MVDQRGDDDSARKCLEANFERDAKISVFPDQLKVRIGRSRKDTTEGGIADAWMATGASMSQRMLEDEEAESRFLSHIYKVALSL